MDGYILTYFSFKKETFEWSGMNQKVEIKKERLPSSRQSMHGYILTYSALKRKPLSEVEWTGK